jgi:O-antigen ligase
VGRFPRITSSFEFASQYASYLIYLIFLYGFLSWNKSFSPFKRAFFAALGLTGLLSLLATQSRAGWISFFGALILSSLFLKRAFLALAGILTISFFILMASPTDLLIHRNQYGHEQSVSERWTLWHRAFEMFRSKPLTGIGINTYNAESARFLSEKKEIINREGKVVKVVDVLPQYYAHNSYLQLAAESGIVSLLLFLVFLGLFFITSIRTIRTANLNSWDKSVLQAVTAGTFGFLILNLFESMFFSVQPAQFFYFFLALGTSLIGIAKMRKV